MDKLKMILNNKKAMVLLLTSVLIILALILGLTLAFMRPIEQSTSNTDVALNSCAKITLVDSGSSINLSNTAPMSDTKGLSTTPYEFKIKSNCDTSIKYKVYIGVLSSNTLTASNIKYAIKDASGNVVSTGKLDEQTEATSDFTSDEITQINSTIGTTSAIYTIMDNVLISKTESTYYLHLWVDSSAGSDTMNKTFVAGVLAKGGEEVIMLADYVKSLYTTDGANGLYLHDGVGTYTNANLEAGDNSYRYAGTNPNNFVCFGSDELTCPYENLYRIIGVFGDQVKLIKYDVASAETMGATADYTNSISAEYYKGQLTSYAGYNWASNASNTWSTSSLNGILNGTYLTNLGSWGDKIVETTWIVGGNTSSRIYSTNAKSAYNYEIVNPAESTTHPAKIGLMYVSDYYYGAEPTYWSTAGSSYSSSSYNSALAYNWMAMGIYEWTITRVSDSSRSAFIVYTSGGVNTIGVNNYNDGDGGVRPSFNLKSSVTYTGVGDGSKINPFRIS